jgi:hypothetical protein
MYVRGERCIQGFAGETTWKTQEHRCTWEVNIKMIFKRWDRAPLLDYYGSGQGQVASL